MPTHQRRPPRNNATKLALLPARLTARDRDLIRLLHEHRVFTTAQLAQVFFDSLDRAEERLRALTELTVVDRFRPHRQLGSAPYHYVLGPAGAAVLAAEHDTTVAALGYQRDRALGIAHSQRLAHQLGVNGFFTALAAYARHHADAALAVWWSERQCAQQWGRLVRPDGYGQWRDHGRTVDFFLEYDTGTEPLERLVTKLDGYTDLAIGTGLPTPVLFWLPGPGREHGLHTALETAAPRAWDRALVPVATATARDGGHPAAPVWWLAGTPEHRRLLFSLTQPGAPRHHPEAAGPAPLS